jgi:hypothetical protein
MPPPIARISAKASVNDAKYCTHFTHELPITLAYVGVPTKHQSR